VSWHFTLGLLGLETPQKRARAVPWHRGVLKQSVDGFPHLVWICLNWQLTLQHELPWKFPNPGSHSSPISTFAFPQTGGRVIEAVPDNDDDTDGVPVPDPVPVDETVLELEFDPDLVLETD